MGGCDDLLIYTWALVIVYISLVPAPGEKEACRKVAPHLSALGEVGNIITIIS